MPIVIALSQHHNFALSLLKIIKWNSAYLTFMPFLSHIMNIFKFAKLFKILVHRSLPLYGAPTYVYVLWSKRLSPFLLLKGADFINHIA